MVKKKITVEIVATTSLPVDRLTATDCNAAARANDCDNKELTEDEGFDSYVKIGKTLGYLTHQ